MKMPTYAEFVQENCMFCGTQRCDPSDPEWRSGCPKFMEYFFGHSDEDDNE